MSTAQVEHRTTAEVARALGVHRTAVIRMVQTGAIRPAAKLPTSTGAYLFDAAEVARVKRARSLSGVEVEAHPDDLGTESLLGRAS